MFQKVGCGGYGNGVQVGILVTFGVSLTFHKICDIIIIIMMLVVVPSPILLNLRHGNVGTPGRMGSIRLCRVVIDRIGDFDRNGIVDAYDKRCRAFIRIVCDGRM